MKVVYQKMIGGTWHDAAALTGVGEFTTDLNLLQVQNDNGVPISYGYLSRVKFNCGALLLSGVRPGPDHDYQKRLYDEIENIVRGRGYSGIFYTTSHAQPDVVAWLKKFGWKPTGTWVNKRTGSVITNWFKEFNKG